VNQFGDLQVDTVKPETVLVPTATCVATPAEPCPNPLPPPNPASHTVDHYECYTVKLSAGEDKFPKDLRARVVDQFSQPTLYDIQKPTALCNPVDKNGEGIKDLDTHLMCYQAVAVPKICAVDAPANARNACKSEDDCGGTVRQTTFCQPQAKPDKVSDIHATNQFGPEQLDTLKVEQMCVPSQKIIDPPLPNQPPTASFTAVPASGEKPLQVSFNASASSDTDGLIVSYSWDFGDGQSGSGKTTSHTYVSKGTFTVTLTVLDNRHGTATASHTVEIKDPPVIEPPFTISAAPNTAEGIQGQIVSYTVTLNSTKGFAQLAALGVAGLPAGISGVLKPKQLAVGQTSILTLSVPSDQAPGTVPFSVSALAQVNGQTVTKSTDLTLNILPITTSFLGRTVVADTLETPLAGVTIKFLGKDDNGNPTGCSGQTVSDAAGNFMFTNLPAVCTGKQLIRYDGLTATAPSGDYAGVDLVYNIVANQVTTSPVLVHLPRIDDKETVLVQQNAPNDQTFHFQTIPGLSVTVYAGTIFTLVDGSQPDPFPLTAIQVPVDRLPEAKPPNPQMMMVFIVAFQPANAEASQPVAVYYPNTINTAPGVNMALMTLDPTKGTMVPYGMGTVSADGTQVIPDLDPAHPGHRFGLVHFDWHSQMPPPPNKNPSPDPCGPKTSNPIDLSSGLEVVRETDIAINGLRGSIFLQRVYRTLSNEAGPFGIGTSHNYRYRLSTNTPLGTAVVNVIMPDGNRFPLAAQQPLALTLTNTTIPVLRGAAITVLPNNEVNLRWKDGTVFHFVPSTFLLGSVLTAITDPNGNTISLVRNPASPDQITEISDPVGRKLTLTYDTASRITAITDPLGRTVRYTYNGQGTLETVTDPEGGVTRYDYDGPTRLTRITNARGVVMVRNTYDADGRVSEQEQADGGKLTFAYTLFNPLAPTSPVVRTVVTDALGNQTTYRFNPVGFLTDVTDALEQTRIVEREPGTNLLLSVKGTASCNVCGASGPGDESFTYDAGGNVLTSTDALGKTTSFTYEPQFNHVASITNPLGEITRFTYDSRGNLTSVKDGNGHATSFAYDAFGQLIKITDPLTHEVMIVYDGLGNPAVITDPLGHATTLRYDAVSRLLDVTDALGQKNGATYDRLDRILTAIDANNKTTQFAYDPVGNLLSLTDAKAHTTAFTYDAINRLLTKRTPSGRTDTRHYDFNGNVTQFVDRRGQTATFAYDVLDRLIRETYQDSTVERLYDPRGHLLRVEDSSGGVFNFTYDLVGRQLSAVGPTGTVQYQRDALGRVTTRQVVGQSPVTYAYDAAGNLLTAAAPEADVTFTYDPRNQLLEQLRSNDVATNYTHDALGRVLSLAHAKGATVLNSQAYTYDAVGNRSQYTTEIAQPLITQPFSSQHDEENRLLQRGAITYTYDENGNRTSETSPAGSITYIWDSRNRLASLVTPDGQTTTFHYDFASNLLAKETTGLGGSSESYVLDNLTNVVYQSDSNNQQFSILTGRSIDSHLAIIQPNGQTDFGLEDTLNSTVATADQNGSVNGQFFYEPYGETTSSGSTYPFQYTGRVPAPDGLYYYRARFYDPKAGRFISEDPIGLQGGGNLYAYVEGNVVNFTDPTGLQIFEDTGCSCGAEDSDEECKKKFEQCDKGKPKPPSSEDLNKKLQNCQKILNKSCGIHETFDAFCLMFGIPAPPVTATCEADKYIEFIQCVNKVNNDMLRSQR
jgi:RHS repeat-associated protein